MHTWCVITCGQPTKLLPSPVWAEGIVLSLCVCVSVCYDKIAVNFNSKQAISHKLGILRQNVVLYKTGKFLQASTAQVAFKFGNLGWIRTWNLTCRPLTHQNQVFLSGLIYYDVINMITQFHTIKCIAQITQYTVYKHQAVELLRDNRNAIS